MLLIFIVKCTNGSFRSFSENTSRKRFCKHKQGRKSLKQKAIDDVNEKCILVKNLLYKFMKVGLCKINMHSL